MAQIPHLIKSPSFSPPIIINNEQTNSEFLFSQSTVLFEIERSKETHFYMDDPEANFYAYVTEDTRYHSIVEASCWDLISKRKEHGRYCEFYSNEEVSFGLYPAFFLAAQDKKFVHLFVEMLKTFDMDHEVSESTCIRYLVGRYQCCNPILELLAARMVNCCGSWGLEDINSLQESLKIDQYFDTSSSRIIMIDNLLKELTGDQWDSNRKNSWIDMLSEAIGEETFPNLSKVVSQLRKW
ncbi:hypothetical protein MNBD_GAMMA12-2060 [hydrothermal vent metagenome]|uniref:Uncharacterized protein n=1 Tax=hydrothermal vent metagenome TaxID=652676 RepID=A0A3B0XXA5_9ZZZZ